MSASGIIHRSRKVVAAQQLSLSRHPDALTYREKAGLAAYFPPVVSAANLGVELGQVRGNLFIESVWQLREWLVSPSATSLIFKEETVKSNPLVEFYKNPDASGSEMDRRRQKFQDDFLATYIRELLGPEKAGKTATAVQLVANIGMNVANVYNEFQSTSHDRRDEPKKVSEGQARILDGIRTVLDQTGGTAKGLRVEHVLNRAGAMTCGGCHQFSNDQPIAPRAQNENREIKWPRSLEFVHVDDSEALQSAVSPALADSFLLERMRILKRVICNDFVEPEIQLWSFALKDNAKTISALTGELRGLVQRVATEKDQGKVVEALREVQAKSALVRDLERLTPGAFRNVRPVH